MQAQGNVIVVDKLVRGTADLSNTGVPGLAAGAGVVIIVEKVGVDTKLGKSAAAKIEKYKDDAAEFKEKKCLLAKLMPKTRTRPRGELPGWLPRTSRCNEV